MMSVTMSAGVRPSPVVRSTSRPCSARNNMHSFTQKRQVVSRGLGDLIGEVNDPEKTRKNEKAKKEGDGPWGEPAPNKNPLEKTGAAHGIGATGAESDKLADAAGKKVDGAVEGAKDAIKKVTGQD